jgi:hypothetical protein
MLKQLLTSIFICIFLLIGSLPAQADTLESPLQTQEEAPQIQVSSEELQKFINSVKQLQLTYHKFQTSMVQAVESEGLNQERFTEIYLAQQNPEAQSKPEITQKEKQDFERAFAKVEQIQLENQSQMKQIVEEEGLEVQRFNQIFATTLQDITLQQKVRQMLQS